MPSALKPGKRPTEKQLDCCLTTGPLFVHNAGAVVSFSPFGGCFFPSNRCYARLTVLAGWPVLRTLAAHLNRWLGAEDTVCQTPRYAVSACQRGTDVVRSKEGGPSLLMNESLPPRWAGIASMCSLGRGRVIPPLGETFAFLNHEMTSQTVT